MALRRPGILVFTLCLCFAAQPGYTQQQQQSPPAIQNVANAASGVWNTLSPGVIFTVNTPNNGTSLTDGTTAAASATPLPTRLAGARVLVNGTAAPLFSASPKQIKAQFPVEMTGITTAAIQVEVTTDAGTVTSDPLNASVVRFSPGIFFINQPPFGPPLYGAPAAILRASDSSQICPEGNSACTANPASPGDVVTIYMTGLGAVDGPWSSGQPAEAASPTLTTPVVIIGGVPATVQFAGLVTGYVGLYQVNVTVPETLVHGDFVPLLLSMGGVPGSQVSLAIRATSDSPQGGGPPFGAANAMAVDPQNHLTIFAATANGVFKSTDGAQSWTASSKGLTNAYIQAVAVDPIHSGTVYAGTSQSGVFKSTDGGANWTAINNGLSGVSGTYVRALAVDPRNSQNLYVLGPLRGGNVPGVFRSTDGGASWADAGLRTPIGSVLVAFGGSNPTTIYAAGSSSTADIYKSTDGGANWNVIGGPKFTFPNGATTPAAISSLAVDPANPAILYAAGGGPQNGVFKSSDGGANWTFFPLAVFSSIGIVAVDPSSSAVYAASSQDAFKSTDGGATWSRISGFPLAFDVHDAGTMYGIGSDGIVKSTDGGDTWTGAANGLTDGSIFNLAVDPRNAATVYAVATAQSGPALNTSKVWKSANGGAAWSDIMTSSVGIGILSVASSEPNIVYAKKGGQLYKSTDAGVSFKAVNSLPVTVSSFLIDPSNSNILYAVSNGALFKSTDGGATFAPLSTTLKCCASRFAIDPTNSSVMYAGIGGNNMGDGVYKSSDGGATWKGVWTGSAHGVQSLAMSQSNPAVIFAMSNSGLFAKTADAGQTWTPVNFGIMYPYASSVLFDSSNSDIVYAGTPNGLLKSNDGGTTWAATSIGLTNLQINVLASGMISGSTVLYAGTSGAGIFKSVDGGASWQPVGAGR